MSRQKVLNLFGGPGAGKSTTAALVFAKMKLLDHRVELVREYAKELTYRQEWELLQEQRAILREQTFRQMMCHGQVDLLVTDSPLLLSMVYGGDDAGLRQKCRQNWEIFDNFNIRLCRVKKYQEYGRSQKLEEAQALDDSIHRMLLDEGLKFFEVDGDEHAAEEIIYLMETRKWLTS